MTSAARNASVSVAFLGTQMGGVEPVHLMENHDQAYYIWREAGLKGRILVHIDAHHDMAWISHNRSVTIANFICRALKEDILKEVCWIVPDPTWATRTGRWALRQHLEDILKGYASFATPSVVDGCITADVLGKRLTICSLDHMPHFAEPILLDIDTDYFIIPQVAYRRRDQFAPLPWCWPEDLFRRLKAHSVSTDLCTIAHSVEGGYVPLKWKFLGNEIAAHLMRRDVPPWFEHLRQGTEAFQRGNALRAETSFEAAHCLEPESAAPIFHLALLCAHAGRSAEARRFYRQTVALDPSYNTAYRSTNLNDLDEGRVLDSERECRIALELDPNDPYAYYGLARIAMKKQRWSDAEQMLRRSLTLLPEFIEAHRSLGKALTKRGRLVEAIHCYELSLRMTLDGHLPRLAQTIATQSPVHRLLDNDHAPTYRELARLYTRSGDAKRASSAYKMAIAAGVGTARTRLELLLLYARYGDWSRCSSEFPFALHRVPADLKLLFRRFWGWIIGRCDLVLPPRAGIVN